MCRDFLVFEHLVNAHRNTSSCARAFTPHELALPSCAVARELVLCDATRHALNASGLLDIAEVQCADELANLTLNIPVVRTYAVSDFFFILTQVSFLVYFVILVGTMAMHPTPRGSDDL